MIEKLDKITGDTSSGECVVIDKALLNKINEIIDVVNTLTKEGVKKGGPHHNVSPYDTNALEKLKKIKNDIHTSASLEKYRRLTGN
jgi:hypothetical protein